MPGRCAACCCHCCRPHAAAAAAVGRRTPRTETSPCRCATCSGGTPSSAAAPPRGRPSPSGCPLRPPLPGGGLHPGRRRAEAAAAERRWRRQRLPRNTLASSPARRDSHRCTDRAAQWRPRSLTNPRRTCVRHPRTACVVGGTMQSLESAEDTSKELAGPASARDRLLRRRRQLVGVGGVVGVGVEWAPVETATFAGHFLAVLRFQPWPTCPGLPRLQLPQRCGSQGGGWQWAGWWEDQLSRGSGLGGGSASRRVAVGWVVGWVVGGSWWTMGLSGARRRRPRPRPRRRPPSCAHPRRGRTTRPHPLSHPRPSPCTAS